MVRAGHCEKAKVTDTQAHIDTEEGRVTMTSDLFQVCLLKRAIRSFLQAVVQLAQSNGTI